MIVPKLALDHFYQYLREQMGLDLIVHDPPMEDELARAVWGDRLMVVRPFSPGADGEQVEVWCGDPNKIQSLEQAWALHWMYLATQTEGLIDADDIPESGDEGGV